MIFYFLPPHASAGIRTHVSRVEPTRDRFFKMTFVRTHYRLSYPATAATAPTAAGFELNIHKTFACMQHKYKDTMWTKLPFQVCFVPPHSRYNYRPLKIVILLIVKSEERLLLLFSWSGCSRES